MKLGELQNMFAEALVRPQSIAHDGEWPARGNREFTGSSRLTPIGQLDVYREQFWLRHVACLAEDFPTVQALVGEETFAALVAEYLGLHPPVHFMLRHLGDHFADFLSTKEDALLSDLARTEWAYIDAFDAPDAPPLDAAAVAAIPEDAWTNARIILHPSVQLLRLTYPAHTLRQQFRETKTATRITAIPSNVIIYRRGLLLYTEQLDPLAFELLDRLAQGETLGAAGDALPPTPDLESKIGVWFAHWASLSLIARIET